MMVSKMLGIKMIISLSMILHCVHCYHLNQNKYLHVTRSCVVVNVAFLLKVYIHNCYPCVIGIWKNLSIKSKMLKSEGLVKKHITYMKHIKIQWYHMGVIFMPKHLIRIMIQCAHILSLIMHFQTGNVYCGVVPTVHVSIFLTKKQIKTWRSDTLNSVSHLPHHWTLYCSWYNNIERQKNMLHV